MKKLVIHAFAKMFLLCLVIFSFEYCHAQSETIKISGFNKVIISPYIEVNFQKSATESVVIENSKIDSEKINVEIDKNTLHIYLDDAKFVGKDEEVVVNGHKQDRPLYRGKQVSITVNYKTLNDVQIRSEERISFEDDITTENFDLDIYGSTKMYFKSIFAEELKVAMYGESYLEIKGGKVRFQRYRCYGKSDVNAVALVSEETKIAAYGDNHIVVNVSDQLKVSAFGDAKIQYKGNAKVNSGLKIGDTVLQKID